MEQADWIGASPKAVLDVGWCDNWADAVPFWSFVGVATAIISTSTYYLRTTCFLGPPGTEANVHELAVLRATLLAKKYRCTGHGERTAHFLAAFAHCSVWW